MKPQITIQQLVRMIPDEPRTIDGSSGALALPFAPHPSRLAVGTGRNR